ncbi:hypothetical protein YK48G_05940 [Lentilactobacillus fungorum]|uniref:Glycosyltransferase RgtA/B/C/D-like domain-containing protein n=2 Tax=Lentilactobacillus fungorum TaxID=2201250 RepID=A0ABQ3VXV6_9LACO|nr:hypothetical protein YK48G_05940 [Lentilactobacillus fungorum]
MKMKQPGFLKLTYFLVTGAAILAIIWLMAATITGYFRIFYKSFAPNTDGLITWTMLAMICLMILWQLAGFFAKRFTGWLVAFIGLMSIPKIVLILVFKLHPISDMYSYNVLAASRANGDSWHWMYHVGVLDLDSIFPHVLHIANLYNYLFKIFANSPKVIQFFNVVVSALTAILVMNIVSYFFNRHVGMFAAMVFFFTPTWYLFTTLIGAEPTWVFLLFLSLWLLKRLVNYRSFSDWHFWVTVGLIAVVLDAAQSIRPLSMAFGIGYSLFVWFRFKEAPSTKTNEMTGERERRAAFWVPRIGILVVAMAFFGLNQLQPRIDRLYFGVPIAKATVGEAYTLAVGTNPKTGGIYSDQIAANLEKYNHNQKLSMAERFDGFNQVLTTQLADNVHYLTKRKAWGKFLYQKTEILMRPEYGQVSFYENTRKKFSQMDVMPRSVITSSTNISTGWEVAMMVLVLLSLLTQLIPKEDSLSAAREQNGILINEIILIGMTLIFLAVEVQSRYQIAFYLPWVALSSIGMRYMMPSLSYQPEKEVSAAGDSEKYD